MSRIQFTLLTIVFLLTFLIIAAEIPAEELKRIPIIYSTDLYHPPQDPDDHYDLAILGSLKELEVKALIFDVATPSRKPEEFGKTALDQMSKITGQPAPPWKIGLRNPLRSADDKALDQPEEFQGGVELILSTLQQSEEQVVMFLVGSCRDFVVAFNRNPDLLRKKVKAVYVNAGNGPKGNQTEWNVVLDQNAYVGLMTSGLPIYWCPCFREVYSLPSPEDVTGGKAYSTFFVVSNQAELLAGASKPVKNYFGYALYRLREEPLGYLDREPLLLPEEPRSMWCTGPFLHAAGRQIYRTDDGKWTARRPGEVKDNSSVVEVFRFEPVRVTLVWKEQDGKRFPVVRDAAGDAPESIRVFRYTHPDFNTIMTSVLADLLETL